jgi:hypothetical protein
MCKFGLVNTRSIRNKTNQFLHIAVTEDLDFCLVVESWLKDNDAMELTSLKPPGYGFENIERKNRNGGGIGIFFKENVNVKIIKSGELTSFEFTEVSVNIGDFQCCVIVVYRPPYSEQHPVTTTVFYEEFSEFVGDTIMTHIDVSSLVILTFMLIRKPVPMQ